MKSELKQDKDTKLSGLLFENDLMRADGISKLQYTNY